MKVLICDDEPLARDRMRRMLDKIDAADLVGEARNGIDLLDQIKVEQPDVVITDIRMPGMDGLEAAEHIAQFEAPPAVVFCTAYDQYAIKAFQVEAIGYLLKPVRQEDLEQVLNKASKVNRVQLSSVRNQLKETDPEPEHQKNRQYISAKSHRGMSLIPLDDVRYFMADQKYVTVRYPEGETLVDETLKELEDEFGARFVRVHRNALVALQHIEAIEHSGSQYQIRLSGIDDRIAISRRHVTAVKKLLQNV